MNVTLIKNDCKVTSSNNVTAALVNHYKCLGFDCLPLIKGEGCPADGTLQFMKDFVVNNPASWPWYDPNDPASTEYLGVYITEVDGLRSTTSSRDVTATVGGSAVGLVKNPKREIVIVGVAFALSERGMAYGRRWEEARWWDNSCGDSVSFRVDCASSLNFDDGLVELQRVVAVAGPTYSDLKPDGQCCDMMMKYEVTLNALDTGFYTSSMVVGERVFDYTNWDFEAWECDPELHMCGPECCSSCNTLSFVDYFSLDVSDCYSRPLMVTREEFLFNPCPSGVELGFDFVFSSGSSVLENTRVLFVDLDGIIFSAFEVGRLSPGSVLKIDGKSGAVWVDCGFGFDRSYDHVFDAGGLPFSNKRMLSRKQFKIVVETDAATVAEDARVQVSVFQRSQNTILGGGIVFSPVLTVA